MPLDNPITIVWDERVQGFTTFQTYVPDSGLSLNNKYFTFKRGLIWEHNATGVSRNSFYDSDEDSIVEVVFNDSPSTIKNFKTLGYEGSDSWSATISTDQESTIIDENAIPRTWTVSGEVASDDFVTRQGKHYAYIRGNNQTVSNLDLNSINVQGLGQGTINNTNDGLTLTDVPSELSVGDNIFFFQHSVPTGGGFNFGNILKHVGEVTSIDTSTNVIGYTFTSVVGAPRPSTNDFFLFSKDNVSEDSGVIGFYGIVRFSTSDNQMAELFSVNTEVSNHQR